MDSRSTNQARMLSQYPRRVLQGNWMAALAADAGATQIAITTTDQADVPPVVLPSQAGLYAGATLEWTGGNNIRVLTTVLNVATSTALGTVLTVTDPQPNPVAQGDEFVLFVGLGHSIPAWTLLGYLATANTNLLAKAWVAPADGLLTMKIGMAAGNTAATFSVSETNKTVTTTEAAGTTIAALNNGTTLSPGAWYSFTFPVVGGCLYQIQTSVAQAITWTATWSA